MVGVVCVLLGCCLFCSRSVCVICLLVSWRVCLFAYLLFAFSRVACLVLLLVCSCMLLLCSCLLLLALACFLGWAGLGWAGLGWAGLGWAGLG